MRRRPQASRPGFGLVLPEERQAESKRKRQECARWDPIAFGNDVPATLVIRAQQDPLRSCDEPLEAWVPTQRREVGIDLQPPRREIIGDLEQGLELVERLLRLVLDDVDPRELVLDVGAGGSVSGDRHDRDAALTLPDRLSLPAQVSKREAERGVKPLAAGRRAELLLVGEPRGVGVDPGAGWVASDGIRLGEHYAPRAPVPVERAWPEPEEQRLFGIVEHPHEIVVSRHKGHEGGVYLLRRGPKPSPRPGQVALPQRDHGLAPDQRQVGRSEGKASVAGLPSLRIMAGDGERWNEQPNNSDLKRGEAQGLFPMRTPR